MECEILLNGEVRIVSEGQSITDLVNDLKLLAARVAVEHNMQILKREKWESTLIREGDRIEIVHFVGGGCRTRVPVENP